MTTAANLLALGTQQPPVSSASPHSNHRTVCSKPSLLRIKVNPSPPPPKWVLYYLASWLSNWVEVLSSIPQPHTHSLPPKVFGISSTHDRIIIPYFQFCLKLPVHYLQLTNSQELPAPPAFHLEGIPSPGLQPSHLRRSNPIVIQPMFWAHGNFLLVECRMNCLAGGTRSANLQLDTDNATSLPGTCNSTWKVRNPDHGHAIHEYVHKLQSPAHVHRLPGVHPCDLLDSSQLPPWRYPLL